MSDSSATASDIVERLRIHVECIEDATPVPYGTMAEVQSLAADEIEALRAVVRGIGGDIDPGGNWCPAQPCDWFSLPRGQADAVRRALAARGSGSPYDEMTPEPACSLCEGEGVVAKNFGLDSPGGPDVVPCPECDGEGSGREAQD